MGIMLLVSCIATIIGYIAPLMDEKGDGTGVFFMLMAIVANAAVALELYFRTKDSGEVKRHHKVHRIALCVVVASCVFSWLTQQRIVAMGSPLLGFGWLGGHMVMLACLTGISCKYLIDKLARNNNSTANQYAKWTEDASILKQTKIVATASISCIVLIAILIGILGNTTGSKVDAFDEMVSKIPSIRSYNASERDDVNETLEKLGLDEKSTTCAIDKEFIEEYLKTHSVEEFFDNLNVVYEYMCGQYGDVDEDRSFYKMKTIITTATDVANIEIMNVDFSNEGAAGFYTENAEEYPPIKTWEVEGKFYNSSGQNIRYETKPCQCEYTYYGDFAVMHSTGYSYDEGRYEWQNGTFYDELPSWNIYDRYHLVYKGQAILYGDDFATSKFWSDAKSIKYFVVGDKTYFLYNSTEQNYGQVWSEFSK